MLLDESPQAQYTGFVSDVEPRLRRALTAAFGSETGREATAEALAYGWQHWDRIAHMANPAGYLFRVGQSNAYRMLRHRDGLDSASPGTSEHWVEPALAPALQALSERQRVVVSLLHAFDWSMAEVANFLGITKASVQSYDTRALKKLRRKLRADR